MILEITTNHTNTRYFNPVQISWTRLEGWSIIGIESDNVQINFNPNLDKDNDGVKLIYLQEESRFHWNSFITHVTCKSVSTGKTIDYECDDSWTRPYLISFDEAMHEVLLILDEEKRINPGNRSVWCVLDSEPTTRNSVHDVEERSENTDGTIYRDTFYSGTRRYLDRPIPATGRFTGTLNRHTGAITGLTPIGSIEPFLYERERSDIISSIFSENTTDGTIFRDTINWLE